MRSIGKTLVFLMLIGGSKAMGAGQQPPQEPTPPPQEPTEPSEPEEPQLPPRDFSDIGRQVDDYFGQGQLLRTRTPSNEETDSCQRALTGERRFMGQIAYQSQEAMSDDHSELDYVASAFGLMDKAQRNEVSLMSHPMCRVSNSSLQHTLRYSSKVPPASVINQLDEFTDRYNDLRRDAFSGDSQALNELEQLWMKFMGCLAYTESLSNPDTSTSERNADRYGPPGYQKPDGVKFYYDPDQQQDASRLNIGIYQFTPDIYGNVRGCVLRWNRINPSCSISTRSPKDDLIYILGSGEQAFNSFCGTDKIRQSFYVQVNTTFHKSTHPDNHRGSSRLDDPEDRCVTPFFHSTRSYNHFGPLQNSTKTNLGKLMSCVLSD